MSSLPLGVIQEEKITPKQKRILFPTAEVTPRIYCLSKINKMNLPLRPIVDCINSIYYNLGKSLADILEPLVGNTIHHVKNSKDLVKELATLNVPQNYTFVSYDVVSLFTKTPTELALKIIRIKLKNDDDLKERTNLSVDDILELLSLLINTTYFSFNGSFYKQIEGVAMGSPVSPIVVNLFLEWLGEEALKTANTEIKSLIWKRYVDDVLAVVPEGAADNLNYHLNSIDPTHNITFTEHMTNSTIPFLDVSISLIDNKITT
ncbi:uncharacterized protein [Antedon mediterranea]|uniref:uncharacterized protein n=1 Tax=Antedon mediterranea TaxID=105859 RepID=UPI003AF7A483